MSKGSVNRGDISLRISSLLKPKKIESTNLLSREAFLLIYRTSEVSAALTEIFLKLYLGASSPLAGEAGGLTEEERGSGLFAQNSSYPKKAPTPSFYRLTL